MVLFAKRKENATHNESENVGYTVLGLILA